MSDGCWEGYGHFSSEMQPLRGYTHSSSGSLYMNIQITLPRVTGILNRACEACTVGVLERYKK